MSEKITQVEANYRETCPNCETAKRCGVCVNFINPSSCSVVEGEINSRWVCDRVVKIRRGPL
jgi:hypothetical protein